MFSAPGIAGMADRLVNELQIAATGLPPTLAHGQLNLALDAMRGHAADLRVSLKDPVKARAAVAKFAEAANMVLAILAAVPLPPQAALVLRIAQLLLPALSGAAAVIWPTLPLAPYAAAA